MTSSDMQKTNFTSELSKNLWVDFCLNVSIINFHLLTQILERNDPDFDGEDFKRSIANEWMKYLNNNMKSQVNAAAKHSSKIPPSFQKFVGSFDPEEANERNLSALKEVKDVIENAIFRKKND